LKKIFFVLGLGFSVGDVTSVLRFWPTLPDPGLQKKISISKKNFQLTQKCFKKKKNSKKFLVEPEMLQVHQH